LGSRFSPPKIVAREERGVAREGETASRESGSLADAMTPLLVGRNSKNRKKQNLKMRELYKRRGRWGLRFKKETKKGKMH